MYSERVYSESVLKMSDESEIPVKEREVEKRMMLERE